MGEFVAVNMVATVEKIGRYEIVSELGRGAMGVVYRAIDPNIGRTVALKTMRLDVHGMEHDDMLRRFKYEARAAGLMNHTNIVTIYDADEVDGLFYIAMEYLEGETLQSLSVEKRVLPADQIVEITRQVAAGLDYAHGAKVIHRDIKPANIMITRQNVAKIMDFGISKVAGSMTSSGQVLGTPNYMSPEQVKGLELDGRADLFSFGVVLYEMTTGERPFAGENVTTIIYKIINEHPIAASDLEMTVHPGLSAVIGKCLAKNPDDRYQTGAELARDMENYRSFGDEGDATFVLPAHNQPPAAPLPPQPRVATQAASVGGRATGTQAAAVRTSRVASSSAPQTAKQTSAVAATQVPRKRTSVVLAIVLLIAVAVATVYGVKHRKQTRPNATTAQQIAAATSSSLPQTSTSQTANTAPQRAEINSAVPKPAEEKPPAKIAVKKPDHLPEKETPTGKVEVRFTSSPTGAFVQIDGKSSSAWITPFTMPDLTPGSHEVVFTKQGYSTETRNLEIGPKKSSYSLDLVPVTTALSVSSEPPGASVEVDGRDTGKVTPAQIPVAEGDHKIALHLDGYHTAQTRATVGKGQVFNFSPTLNPGDARQAGNTNPVTTRLGKIFVGGIRGGKGMIDFVTNPPGAKIFIQGRAMAFATPAHVPIPEGDYRIEFREAGYKPVQQNIHVEAGKNVKVTATLEPQ